MPEPSRDDWSEDLALALELCDAADAITTQRFRARDLHVETKPDLTPVSEADRAVEAVIRHRLAGAHPDDAILGEEMGTTGDARRRWIVDPIDGTKSYVRGVPVWATLLALEADGEPVVGVVSAPALGRRWWAAAGAGAFADGDRINVSDVHTLEDAQLCFANFRDWEPKGLGESMLALAARVWRAVGFGDFWGHMLVAEGAAEAMIEPELALWDVAALRPIISEAGGRCTDLAGRPATGPGGCVTTNGHVHGDVLAALGGTAARGAMSPTRVTVGLDIGTSSVKAVAADDDGNVVASARVPHEVRVPAPLRFEHDADVAWRRGPREALSAVARDLDVRGVSVAAMVPSLTAVDGDGVPLVPGLLYGDERGRTTADGVSEQSGEAGNPAESGELLGFLRWCLREAPDAAGVWPAQATANHALSGEAVLDTSTAATAYPLFDWTGWDADVVASVGARPDQLPRLVPTGWEAARVDGDGPPLASGCIDALAEQLVAGADSDGDVLVLLGTTLIVWAVAPMDAPEVPGFWTIPHTASGKNLIGGPSNAGGMFCNWVNGWLRDPTGPPQPTRVPVFAPYPRGERTPLHDPHRRARVVDLDLTHDAAALRRASFEASGFVVRRVLDAARAHAGVQPRRLVATGGGVRVGEWVQALADATQMPVDCVAVPEGGALGSAWLARIAAGLEEATAMTDGHRWARVDRTIEPDADWVGATEDRYARFLEIAGPEER